MLPIYIPAFQCECKQCIKMTLTLYMYPASPPARAVLLAAAYLGIALEQKQVDIAKGEQFQVDFLKMNPQHTVPTLDDDGNVIWDSHAIMGYLVNKYAKDDSVYPKGDPYKHALIDQRMHFETGILFTEVRKLVTDFVMGAKQVSDEDVKESYKIYEMLETFLEGKKWMVGDSVTLADFSLIPSVTTLDLMVPLDARKYPKLKAWVDLAKETFPQYEEINDAGLNLMKTHLPL